MSITHNYIESWKFPFFNGAKREECALSIASMDGEMNPLEKLSNKEMEKWSSFSLEKRKRQYYLGRITTKEALSKFTDELVFRDISVLNKELGCPFIEGSRYSTTITHTNEVVASLVFEKKFSVGIDIEDMRENAIKALKFSVSNNEQISNNLKDLTVAWTLKESLSKALKCGFHLSFEEFELHLFSRNDNVFLCSYTKHPEFKGIALVDNNKSFAIAYPSEFEVFSFFDLNTWEKIFL
ncbi:MAG: 4'-phosphopantetheinyl transferase superfamily protein [Holosporaceae bacterium]|jgi:phosphopantetheinyl transferase (holo-ACP synthase)|nr:4'-phosphopantetheinyl transferase superfamily protein [Holosporaceae bacterium]